MKGVRYVVDEKGRPEAVLIDLKKHRALWEDFQDLLVSASRRNEPRVSLEEVEARLRKAGKLK
jgi:phage baseplate assembly protein W